MATPKHLRVFQLAHDLRIDAGVLVEIAQRIGIRIRSSVLAKVTAAEREAIIRLVQHERCDDN